MSSRLRRSPSLPTARLRGQRHRNGRDGADAGRLGRCGAVPSGGIGLLAGGADVARHPGLEAGIPRDGPPARGRRLCRAGPQPLLPDQARADRHRPVRLQRSQAGPAAAGPEGDADRRRDRQGRGRVHQLSSTSRSRPTAARAQGCRAIASAARSLSTPRAVRSDRIRAVGTLPRRRPRHQGREQPAPADPRRPRRASSSRSRATTTRNSPRRRMC